MPQSLFGKRFLLALLSGVGLVGSFPPWDDFLPGNHLLAWIAFIPLFFAMGNRPPKERFLLGWLTGLVYFSGTIWWVTISMRQYGGLPVSLAFLLMLLLVAYLACYAGGFALCIGPDFLYRPAGFLLPALFWTTFEYLRAHLLTGFPWSALGYSQYRFLSAIQIADFSSVYGVGFVIVLFNTALTRLIQTAVSARKLDRIGIGVVFSVFALTFGYGQFRLQQPMGGTSSLKVGVVQGNIPQDRKWDDDFKDETIHIYKRLSESTRPESPALLVWPESATPFFFQVDPHYQAELLDLTQAGRFTLLFGSPAFDPSDSARLYNSAYFLSPTSGILARYDKMHLVPFGEYVPLSSLLFFVDKITMGIGDFAPGNRTAVVEVAGEKIGTAICFEVIFPELVRKVVDQGATIMTTITNDAWFGRSPAASQHFSMVVFRAVENRVPFARAANTGISGFIDAHGRIVEQTPLFVEAALTRALSPGIRKSFYTTYGDLFPIACLIVGLFLMVRSKPF
jgi:apolipoprotein N-acyltransferase